MISADQFTGMFPRAKNATELVEAMNDIFPKYDINTPQRMAGFIVLHVGWDRLHGCLGLAKPNRHAKPMISCFAISSDISRCLDDLPV
jgi:hypothetical protein